MLADRRVPKAEKALLVGSVIYALSPFDFLPDLIPFLGQVDDAFLVALTLLRLIDRTDERIIREHWRGSLDVVNLAGALAAMAPHLLPQRMSRVLSSRVEMAPEARKQIHMKEQGAGAPPVVEVPYE
ncbi:MAG: YkvA family protein [Pyrinomonadaceae bacterium]